MNRLKPLFILSLLFIFLTGCQEEAENALQRKKAGLSRQDHFSL